MLVIIIVILCLVINSILACAEMAFVSVNKGDLRKKSLSGDRSALIVMKMLVTPEKLLSVIQIGITLVGAISAAVGGAGSEETIAPFLADHFEISEDLSEVIAISIVVVPLTFFSVIIGELVPKSIALRYSLPVILRFAKWLYLTERVLTPLVFPMEKMTKIILNKLFLDNRKEDVEHSTEEISLTGLKKEHKQYVHNLIDLDAKNIKSVMMPWSKVNYVMFESDASTVLDVILSSGHTRLPVMADKEICGFLHAKEFLHLFKSSSAENWASFMRPPKFIPEETKLLDALKLMQSKHIHILIVGDEKNPKGIVTLEDVLEEVIGEIVDEHEDDRVKLFLRRSFVPKK